MTGSRESGVGSRESRVGSRGPPAACPEIGLVAGLVMFAFAIRWPDYLYIPTFTDETEEVLKAALIAQGRILPLTNATPFIGPFYNYLLAGLFILIGPYVELPRLLVLTTGSLTVVPAYLLGRELGGRLVGAIAAGLLATNPAHVLIDSHVAWSNGMTPFFTTLGFWLLVGAAGGRRGRVSADLSAQSAAGQVAAATRPTSGACRPPSAALCAVGVLFGLALQTHPSSVVLLPAAVAHLAWKAPALLRTRGPWLALVAFLLTYSPLIIYNVATGFDSVRAAQLAGSMDPSSRGVFGLGTYVSGLGGYGLLLLRTMAGAIDTRRGPAAYLLDPTILAWLVIGLVSLGWLARRGQPLPLLATVSALVFAAFFNTNSYDPLPNGRYVLPTIVLIYVAIAVCGVELTRSPLAPRIGRLAPGLVGLGCAFLMAHSLVALAGYDEQRPADNQSLIEAVAALSAARQPGEEAVLDQRLTSRRAGLNVHVSGILQMLLTIRRIPYRYASFEAADLPVTLAGKSSLLAIVDHDNVRALSEQLIVTPISTIPPLVARARPVEAWRDWPLTTPLRWLDPRAGQRRRSDGECDDCVEHAVVRLANRT